VRLRRFEQSDFRRTQFRSERTVVGIAAAVRVTPAPRDLRRKAALREEIATAERRAKAIQEKLDRLNEAFLFERSIDIEPYDRHAEKLREELTLARIDLIGSREPSITCPVSGFRSLLRLTRSSED
jgi:hypothetical protein